MGSENNCGFELENTCGRAIGHQRLGSLACFVVVMLKYAPHSHISIIWKREGERRGRGDLSHPQAHVTCVAASSHVHPCCRACTAKNKIAPSAVAPSHRSWR